MIPDPCLTDTLSIDFGEVFSDLDFALNTVKTIIWSDDECTDTDDGAVDNFGTACGAYKPWWCSNYDDDDFESNSMCCKCGGGYQGIVSSANSLTSCGTYSWEISSVPPNAPGLTANLD